MSGECDKCGWHATECKCDQIRLNEQMLTNQELLDIWNDMDYNIKLAMTEFIFQRLTDEPSVSFRKMIYDRLGFGPDAYSPLYNAGGMTITNALDDYRDDGFEGIPNDGKEF